jgi:hypothetical protein
MNKKIYSLFSILFLLLSTGCTLQNPAENSGVKVTVLKDSFYVVFDRNFKPEDARKASVTGEVPGRKHTFSLTEKKEFDLKNICSSYTPIKDAAIVSFVVYSPENTTRLLGMGADYWHTCYLNGKLVGTTEPAGEPTPIPSYLNNCWKVELKKGNNRFFVHTRPGTGGSWLFTCGLLPSLEYWPETQEDRLKFFNKVYPQKESLTGPFVTHVSTDSAKVSFEYSKNIAAALRYKISGSKTSYKTIADRPVYGRIPRKKIHRFELKKLQPGTKYDFELLDREKIPGVLASGSFKTLPSGGVKHVMTAISDTQTLDIIRRELIRSLVKQGIFKGTDMLVSLGDVTSTFFDFSKTYFHNFLYPFREGGVTAPYYPVRGNHEYRGPDTDKFTQFFGCPYYAFRYGDVLYIVLDTGEDKPLVRQNGHYTLLTDTRQYFQEQKKWLEKLIKSDMCKTAKKRIVLAHTTPFEWEKMYYAQNIAIFASVFYGKNPQCPIDLWLCGDIHCPYRFDPVTGELAGAARTPSQRRPCRLTPNDWENIHFPVYVNDGPRGAGRNFSVTRLESGDGFIKLTCTGDDGKIMDEIIIRKGRPFEVKQSIYRKYTPYK